MYKLLIVDDEEIERVGMAEFIPWSEHGIELIGTAWNGVDALEQMEKECPDIVLTDIKMPVMDGLELTENICEKYPDTKIIILSGYGEFNYTSRAMESGIRHYILKPCDEEKVMEVFGKVMTEMRLEEEERQRVHEYHCAVRKLLPRAKEQVFQNLILGREQLENDYGIFMEELQQGEASGILLALRNSRSFDTLEQFIAWNVLREILGAHTILLYTVVNNDLVFLIDIAVEEKIREATEAVQEEFKRALNYHVDAAVSRQGVVREAKELYEQVKQLFHMESDHQEVGFFQYSMLQQSTGYQAMAFDYQKIKDAEDYEAIVFECYVAFVKMDLKQYDFTRKKEICNWTLKVLYEDQAEELGSELLEDAANGWDLLRRIVEIIAKMQQLSLSGGKEEERLNSIYWAVYENLTNPNLNIQFLAKEVLYMNEDYFGRLFSKHQKKKFSGYLQETRIMLARRLLDYDCELKISRLAEITGYAPDGQYFSKAFKKVIGKTPTEYRDSVK